jgi:SAM-dependent methyltransferase
LRGAIVAIEAHLEEAFGDAAADHFAWQTEHPYVGARERELVRAAFLPLGTRLLDVGCGEGATLVHLGAPAGATGIDLFEKKIAYARERLPGCRFAAGSAYELPFADGAFDHVIVRDLVHHLEEPERFVDECVRVLERGGRVDVLETCRNNPLVLAHGLLLPVERGELRSSMRYVRGLLGRRFEIVSTSRHQAFPIHRVLFHPDMGAPRLAERPFVRGLTSAIEGLADKLVPSPFRAYLHVRARKAP